MAQRVYQKEQCPVVQISRLALIDELEEILVDAKNTKHTSMETSMLQDWCCPPKSVKMLTSPSV